MRKVSLIAAIALASVTGCVRYAKTTHRVPQRRSIAQSRSIIAGVISDLAQERAILEEIAAQAQLRTEASVSWFDKIEQARKGE